MFKNVGIRQKIVKTHINLLYLLKIIQFPNLEISKKNCMKNNLDYLFIIKKKKGLTP